MFIEHWFIIIIIIIYSMIYGAIAKLGHFIIQFQWPKFPSKFKSCLRRSSQIIGSHTSIHDS